MNHTLLKSVKPWDLWGRPSIQAYSLSSLSQPLNLCSWKQAMSTWYFLKKAARTSFLDTLFWNSVVPNFDGIVRRAATFHVIIFNVFTGLSTSSRGAGLFRRGYMGVSTDICVRQRIWSTNHRRSCEIIKAYFLNATVSTLQHRIRRISTFSICLHNDLRLWMSIFFLSQQTFTLNYIVSMSCFGEDTCCDTATSSGCNSLTISLILNIYC